VAVMSVVLMAEPTQRAGSPCPKCAFGSVFVAPIKGIEGTKNTHEVTCILCGWQPTKPAPILLMSSWSNQKATKRITSPGRELAEVRFWIGERWHVRVQYSHKRRKAYCVTVSFPESLVVCYGVPKARALILSHLGAKLEVRGLTLRQMSGLKDVLQEAGLGWSSKGVRHGG
jgi:hypothetical protein